MARVEATYDEGTVVYDDGAGGNPITGDADLIAAFEAQTGLGRPIPEMPTVLLASYDASPWHFIAAADALLDPQKPTLASTGVEASEAFPGFVPE